MTTETSDNSSSIALGGTTWTVTGKSNGQGTFVFNIDNTGTYHMSANDKQLFYWWQKGNAFWAQEQRSEKNWFSIIEGTVDSGGKGNANIVVGQHNNGLVVVEPLIMTQS